MVGLMEEAVDLSSDRLLGGGEWEKKQQHISPF